MRPGQIHIRDVGVSYRLYREKVSTLKEAVVQRFSHLRSSEIFWALRHINMEIQPTPPEAIAKVVDDILRTPQPVVERARVLLGAQNR